MNFFSQLLSSVGVFLNSCDKSQAVPAGLGAAESPVMLKKISGTAKERLMKIAEHKISKKHIRCKKIKNFHFFRGGNGPRF